MKPELEIACRQLSHLLGVVVSCVLAYARLMLMLIGWLVTFWLERLFGR